jgi:hypothetical protein
MRNLRGRSREASTDISVYRRWNSGLSRVCAQPLAAETAIMNISQEERKLLDGHHLELLRVFNPVRVMLECSGSYPVDPGAPRSIPASIYSRDFAAVRE